MYQKMLNVGGGSGASSADKVSYDNTISGLESDNVQGAIDEVNSNLDNFFNVVYENSGTGSFPVAQTDYIRDSVQLDSGIYFIVAWAIGTYNSTGKIQLKNDKNVMYGEGSATWAGSPRPTMSVVIALDEPETIQLIAACSVATASSDRPWSITVYKIK